MCLASLALATQATPLTRSFIYRDNNLILVQEGEAFLLSYYCVLFSGKKNISVLKTSQCMLDWILGYTNCFDHYGLRPENKRGRAQWIMYQKGAFLKFKH